MTIPTKSHNGVEVGVCAVPGATHGDSKIAILRVGLPHEDPEAAAAAAAQRPETVLNMIFDNSMSMGSHCRAGVDLVGRQLVSSGLFQKSSLTLFDDKAASYDVSTIAKLDALLMRFPSQGMTNITAGVEAGMKHGVCRVAADDSLIASAKRAIGGSKGRRRVHVVTFMLTDGGHNTGPRPSRENLQRVKREVEASMQRTGVELLHTVIMMCLTASSDATVSMDVKGVFENAEVPSLPSVFYANTHHEMNRALTEVIAGCNELLGVNNGRFVRVALPAGGTILSSAATSVGNAPGAADATVHVKPGNAQMLLVAIPSGACDNAVIIDGEMVPDVPAGTFELWAAQNALRAAMAPLTRMSVMAESGPLQAQLTARIAAVDKLVEAAMALQAKASTANASGPLAQAAAAAAAGGQSEAIDANGVFRGMCAADRRRLLKVSRGSTTELQTLRNQLYDLKVRSRSNSDKIELLTGNTRKFASVAAARSKSEGRDVATVVANTASLKEKIAELIREDLAARGASEAELPTSLLSLSSQEEMLREWTDAAVNDGVVGNGDDIEGIFEVLCSLGMLAAPIKVEHADCAQVDPMQLTVSRVGHDAVDTASMMCAFKINQPLKLTDGETYVDCLPLIDPAFPRTTAFLLKRSHWAEHLVSAVLARDLHMYLPAMQVAAHTKAFAAAVNDTFENGLSASGVRLSLRLLYSAFKFIACKRDTTMERELLAHWLEQKGTLTRAESDRVDHPVYLQLLLALFASDHEPELEAEAGTAGARIPWSTVDERAVLLNLLNEVLARRVKASGGSADVAQKLLGITSDLSPKAQADPFADEPPEAAIRDACPKAPPASFDQASAATRNVLGQLAGGGLDGADQSVTDFVETVWEPAVRLHRFTTALLIAQQERGRPVSVASIMQDIEAAGHVTDEIVVSVRAALKSAVSLEPSVWDTLYVETPRERRNAAVSALTQALIYNSTKARAGVVHTKDVTDGETMREMVEMLHMVHYHTSLTAKVAQFQAMVGDVTRAEAMRCDVATLRGIIGVHTHGHCSDKFWALVEGILMDADAARRDEKLDIFAGKSNQGVDKAINRARSRLTR